MEEESERYYASPPCYQHEFDGLALARQLNELVEAERAGARGLIDMKAQCDDPVLAGLLDEVARDEARFCAMLRRHVERLGGAASGETGGFYRKLMARESQRERLQLLDRGQSVVVKVLDDLLEQPLDAGLRADLEEMREVHVQNIERCARYL